jgi:hypothetical protein
MNEQQCNRNLSPNPSPFRRGEEGNLTPNPFPRGKGDRKVGSNRFPSGKGDRNVRSNSFPRGKGDNRAFGFSFLQRKGCYLQSGSPSHYGKGLGVRLRAHRALKTGAI